MMAPNLQIPNTKTLYWPVNTLEPPTSINIPFPSGRFLLGIKIDILFLYLKHPNEKSSLLIFVEYFIMLFRIFISALWSKLDRHWKETQGVHRILRNTKSEVRTREKQVEFLDIPATL